MKNYRISVKDLIEFVLRNGDIETGDGVIVSSNERALLGTRLHRKIQKEWQKRGIAVECVLSHRVNLGDYELTVEGRADAVEDTPEYCAVYEIKTTDESLLKIDDNFDMLHWAQAFCYAYIYSLQNNLKKIDVVLVYCNIETENTIEFKKECRLNELEKFFNDVIDKYNVFLSFSHKWSIRRNETIRNLAFPFKNFRNGQKDLCDAVYKTIKNRCKLFVQAPTGTGKTMSVIFPAIKALGEDEAEKIFYLTARTTTRSIPQEAINILCENSLDIIYITLYAREKICFNDKVNCSPESCRYAKGHYDRINDALIDSLRECKKFDWDNIIKYAEKHCVCPFEFSLDLALWCDVVICDYNYLFDPRAYLRRFFPEEGGQYVFLVDEAHNLVDRAREMFSAVLVKQNVLNFKKYTKDLYPALHKSLSAINQYFIEKSKMMNKSILGSYYYIEKELDPELQVLMDSFLVHARDFLETHEKNEKYEDFLQLYFDISFFTKIIDLYDENFCTYMYNSPEGPVLKIFCINPSKLLEQSFAKGIASVLFSATLIPMDYYFEILGGNENDDTLVLDSPFLPENKCVIAAKDVVTTYNRRMYSFEKIADYIKITVDARPGNYFVFFPSYKYMQDVYDLFRMKYPDLDAVLQDRNYNDREREEFINSFEEGSEKTRIGFCVLGGAFSEGIDLKNDRLIGAIIIGVGLPLVCLEREIIRNYYSSEDDIYYNGDRGFNYAYVFPGITKVMQAAGRVIRTEFDRGVILLLDERFASYQYKELFPDDWYPVNYVTVDEIRNVLDNFW